VKLIYIFLLAFISFALISLQITGIIRDETGNYLENVLISTGERATQSDREGVFILKVSSEVESLFFHRIGYQDLRLKAVDSQNVIMQRKPVVMEPIAVNALYETHLPVNTQIIKINSESNLNLPEILQNQTTLSIKNVNQANEKKTASIQGHNPRHTKVLIDGVELNMQGQEFDLSTIPTAIIDRIYISSGNADNTSAIGGVINIITRGYAQSINEKSAEIFLQNSAGSFDSYSNSISADFSSEKYGFTFILARQSAKNDFPYSFNLTNEPVIKKRKNNHKEIYDANFHGDIFISPLRIHLRAFYQDFSKGLPGTINQINNFDKAHLDGKISRNFLSLISSYRLLQAEQKFYYINENTQYTNTESTNPYYSEESEIRTYKTGSVSQLGMTIRNLYLCSGLEVKKENITENKYMPQKGKAALRIYGSGEYKRQIKSFELQFSGNAADYLNKEGGNNYGINGGVTIGKSLRLLIQSGYFLDYNEPSFYELYWKGDKQVIGNPDLLSEKSKGWKINTRLDYLKSFFTAGFFNKHMENMIFWHYTPFGWKPDNISRSEITNLETSAHLTPYDWISLDFSWLRTLALDKTEKHSLSYDKQIVYTPTSKTIFSLTWKIYKLNTTVSYIRIGRQWSTSDHLFDNLPSSEMINASFQYHYLLGRTDLGCSLELDNLFDRTYSYYSLMPAPGFNWRFSLSVNYKINDTCKGNRKED